MRILICTLVLLVGVCLVAAPADAADFTFTGDVNCGWNVDGNWDLENYPQAGDTATIPSGKMVCIGTQESPSSSACYWINVETGAVVEIHNQGRSLTISANSTIRGDILFKGIGV